MKTNKEIIYDLVKNHFGLDKESLDLFKSKLFSNTDIAPEYKKILGEETRKYFKIEDDVKEGIDEGWSMFKTKFISFVEENDTTYSEFKNNAFNCDGKKYRMIKALKAFYCNPQKAYRFFNGFYRNIFSENDSALKKLFFGDRVLLVKEVRDLSFENDKYIIRYTNKFGKNITLTKNVLTSKFEKFFENQDKEIEEYFNRHIEYIGTKRFPNKDMYAVLSVDFEDWFLCSTAEKWSSCLSLESSHDGAFWNGLPGIITDKNRALVYITDKEKKTYNDISVDHIISRSWILLGKNGKPYFVNNYPSRMNLEKIVKDFIFNDLVTNKNFEKSKYDFEPLFTKIGNKRFLLYIYEDTSSISLEEKGKKIYASLAYGRGKHDWVVKRHLLKTIIEEYDSDVFCYSSGLNQLIRNKEELKNYTNSYDDENSDDDDE